MKALTRLLDSEHEEGHLRTKFVLCVLAKKKHFHLFGGRATYKTKYCVLISCWLPFRPGNESAMFLPLSCHVP
jgi:hypothetical protein